MTNEGAIAYFEILLEKQEGKFAQEWLREAIAALKAEPCEDAISRQAMLDGLASIAKAKARSDAQKALMGRVMFFTEHLPPVTSKPMECEDCVSREAVLEITAETGALETQARVKALPPVTPQPKIGHWIVTGDYLTTAYGSVDYVKCSCCGEDSLEEGTFCPNCGAKMEGE